MHPHVLVIEELGYQSYAADAANVLYRVVNDRYLHGQPMVFTTNKQGMGASQAQDRGRMERLARVLRGLANADEN